MTRFGDTCSLSQLLRKLGYEAHLRQLYLETLAPKKEGKTAPVKRHVSVPCSGTSLAAVDPLDLSLFLQKGQPDTLAIPKPFRNLVELGLRPAFPAVSGLGEAVGWTLREG